MIGNKENTGFALKWFVIPSIAVFFIVNVFQIGPLLAHWTVISLLGLEGAVLPWMALVVLYSLLLALLGGFCSYRFASSRPVSDEERENRTSADTRVGVVRNTWVLVGFATVFLLTVVQLSPILADVTIRSALRMPDAENLWIALTLGYSLIFASLGGLGGYAFERVSR